MTQLGGSLYIVSTAAFALISAVLGIRLLLLSFELVTGVLGITTVGLYWLTFFPPVWYRLRLSREKA